MSPPPPRWVRRLVVDPLAVPLLLGLAAFFAGVAAVGALLAPFTRHRRLLRFGALAASYVLLDLALLLGCAGLWLRRPVRWGPRSEQRWTAAHTRLLRWAMVRLMAAAERTVDFRMDIDPAAEDLPRDDRPVLLLARHAGPGDSFALVWLVLVRLGRTPRVVLKDVLQWDPGLDVVLTRLEGCFLPSRTGAGDDTARVAAEAADLGPGQVMLLFPEGGNWTPGRHRRAVRHLWRTGERRAARQAAAHPHVLPPRPGGTAAALAARPDLDVVVVAHSGLDRLTTPWQVWSAIPVGDRPMRVRWWRVPAPEVPRATEDDVAEWLNQQWAEVARWVDAGPGTRPG